VQEPGEAQRRDRLIRPEDRGTAEAAWSELIAGGTSASFDRPLLVVAPHPDDETFGAGGLLATASRRHQAHVVVCSDGEAAGDEPGLAERRRGELREALRSLAGEVPIARTHLGLPDGGLAAHVGAIREAVTSLLGGRTLVVAPWPGDGHPDHRAVGEACRDLGSVGADVLWYPIWAWHWATPADLQDEDLVCADLDPDARAAKRAATRCYRSQLEGCGGPPVLTRSVRAHFDRAREAFFRAPVRPSTRRAQR
jgi:LmbE family N-acetylglucosaminyl deacetylase